VKKERSNRDSSQKNTGYQAVESKADLIFTEIAKDTYAATKGSDMTTADIFNLSAVNEYMRSDSYNVLIINAEGTHARKNYI
jgi:hypothetical protein